MLAVHEVPPPARARRHRLPRSSAAPSRTRSSGGDISTAPSLARALPAVRSRLARPGYFVLGNHDYYPGDIASVHTTAVRLADADDGLRWLERGGAVGLTPATALVGQGGWGDVGYGNPATPVELNDFRLIADLAGQPAFVRNARLARLGEQAAASLDRDLAEAVSLGVSEVVVLMHVPPFREAAWHKGRLSDDDWLPFFACRAAGQILLEAAAAHPAVRFAVLCGHTYSAGEATLAPNLRVSTAAAAYGRPTLARVLEVR
jgi:predicted phosphohydrolase